MTVASTKMRAQSLAHPPIISRTVIKVSRALLNEALYISTTTGTRPNERISTGPHNIDDSHLITPVTAGLWRPSVRGVKMLMGVRTQYSTGTFSKSAVTKDVKGTRMKGARFPLRAWPLFSAKFPRSSFG